MDFAALVEPVSRIAKQAGGQISAIYRTPFVVTAKSDKSLLTEADLAAHDIIAAGLQSLTPQIPLLSEEDPAPADAIRLAWEWLWLVDPLDGTWQFVQRRGEFCVNIALIHRQIAVFGLIYVPEMATTYYAWQGGGAYKQWPDGKVQRIYTRPLADPPMCVAGSLEARGSLRRYLQQLGDHKYSAVGSALKSCLVAEGAADLYARFGPTAEWDTAAAQVIVEEAGGAFTDFTLQPLRYNARNTLINPNFFAFGDPRHDWTQYLPPRL